MHFTINAASLAKALQTVARVVQKRNTIPILSNIVVTAEGRTVTLQATDLDCEISLQTDGNVIAEGGITVEAHLFAEIARKMQGDITFKFDGERAIVSSGRSKFSLQTLPVCDFPTLSVGAFTHTFTMAAADLRRMIKQTSFAISTEETRYYLCGIFMHTIEDQGADVLRTVATDGHRLARIQMKAPVGAVGMPGIIIPRKTVGEIDKLVDGSETVTVEVSESKIRLTAGGAVLTSKLIDGTFPDYQRVIPALSNTKAVAGRTSFSQAIDRVSTVSSERGRAVKVTFSEGQVLLNVSSPDHGEASEELAVDFEGEEVAIGFNAKYVTDILGNIEAKNVEIFLTDAGSPARIHSSDDDSAVYVLMPMRV